MLFKGFRFARAEIQNTTANAGIKVAMAAISVIPLLYGALYLLAFLNPYEQLDAVPVAVVNKDAGYEINGEFQVIGNNVIDRLKKTENGLGWNFVTTKQAQEGIEDGTYYMTCTIPKNFSETLASANSRTPQSAQLVIEYNETKNMLASQIGASVWKEVRQQVSNSIAKEFWIHTFSQINRGADDIEEAANGANSLQNGLAEAKNGSQKITDGLSVLNSGAQDLSGGLNKLSSGAEQLQSGTGALSQGAYSLFSGATALFEGSSSLAAGTSSLSQGLDSLSEGSSTLSTGAGELSDSMQTLAEGIDTLNKGSQTLKTNSQSLASNTLQLKDLGTAPLASGTSELRNAASMLPTERDVEEARTAQTSISNGMFTLVQGLDNLYAGLESINDELFLIGDEISNTQTDTLRAQQQIKDALTLLSGIDTSSLSEADSDALSQALDLLSDSTGAANTLQSTSAELNSIYENFNGNGVVFNGVQTALNTLGNSSQPETLRGGVCAIQSGFSSFSSSTMPLMEGSPNLSESIQIIDDAAQQIDKNMGTLSAGVQALADGTNQLQNGLADASSGSKKLEGGSKSLYDATEELHGGILQALAGSIEVNNGTLSLNDGTFQLKQGAQELSNGASTVNDGVSNLSKGAHDANDGSKALQDGAETLESGSSDLTNGLNDAFSGSETLARGLLEGSQNMHVDATQKKASMLSSPVTLKETYYGSVKNYGTGFAPYFIGLALWIGALMGSFIFKPLNRRLILSGMSPIRAAFVSYMPLALLALVQVFLLLLALQFGLKLQIDNVIAYYIFGVAVALTFAALIQMLMGVFGFPGKFIAIVLLMLQLTSAAGTFPIEQTPKFFQVISPFLPMTYVVSGMREIMTGSNIGLIIEAVGMLFIFATLSFIITISTARKKRMVNMDDLHPLIQL